jgi:hypothetical protein
MHFDHGRHTGAAVLIRDSVGGFCMHVALWFIIRTSMAMHRAHSAQARLKQDSNCSFGEFLIRNSRLRRTDLHSFITTHEQTQVNRHKYAVIADLHYNCHGHGNLMSATPNTGLENYS